MAVTFNSDFYRKNNSDDLSPSGSEIKAVLQKMKESHPGEADLWDELIAADNSMTEYLDLMTGKEAYELLVQFLE